MSGFVFGFPRGFDRLSGLVRADVGLGRSPSGGIALHDNVGASVTQSIGMILATTPGERVLRPEYGSRLMELVFMPNDAATVGLAIQYVKEAIARFEPRVIVDTVDAGPDPDDLSKLVISITYRIRGEAAVHGYEAVVDLEGTGRP